MSRKHSKIYQQDGVSDSVMETAVDDDEQYAGSKHFWKTGWLGSVYQSFLDANDTIDKCDISEEDKEIQIQCKENYPWYQVFRLPPMEQDHMKSEE